jgi:hypothetical protein
LLRRALTFWQRIKEKAGANYFQITFFLKIKKEPADIKQAPQYTAVRPGLISCTFSCVPG